MGSSPIRTQLCCLASSLNILVPLAPRDAGLRVGDRATPKRCLRHTKDALSKRKKTKKIEKTKRIEKTKKNRKNKNGSLKRCHCTKKMLWHTQKKKKKKKKKKFLGVTPPV